MLSRGCVEDLTGAMRMAIRDVKVNRMVRLLARAQGLIVH